MELPKPLNEVTDEEIDALDVELLSDEEIEEIEQKLKAMFTPEELDALFNPVEEIREEDIVHYEPSEKYRIQDSTVVIGHLGKIYKPKNHHFLVSLFDKFHKMNSDSCLLLVGDGEITGCYGCLKDSRRMADEDDFL